MHGGRPVYLYVNIVQRTKLVDQSIFLNIKMLKEGLIVLIFHERNCIMRPLLNLLLIC